MEAPAEQAFANVVPEVDSVPSKEVGEVAERQQEILVDAAPGGNDTPFEEVAEVAESQQEVIADVTPEGGRECGGTGRAGVCERGPRGG